MYSLFVRISVLRKVSCHLHYL